MFPSFKMNIELTMLNNTLKNIFFIEKNSNEVDSKSRSI
jgi:hypothetical protein